MPFQMPTHRMTKTSTYYCWANMIQRCTNPNTIGWKRYGGRGIAVCSRWRTFINFLEDMGERPSERFLERIDNNKGYEPANYKWATRLEQSRNTRRNVYLTFDGITTTRKEWAEKIGISEAAIKRRLLKGWPIEKALTIGFRSAKERLRNQIKGQNHFITFNNKTQTLAEWVEELKIPKSVILHRLKAWGTEKALSTPYKPRRNQKPSEGPGPYS